MSRHVRSDAIPPTPDHLERTVRARIAAGKPVGTARVRAGHIPAGTYVVTHADLVEEFGTRARVVELALLADPEAVHLPGYAAQIFFTSSDVARVAASLNSKETS